MFNPGKHTLALAAILALGSGTLQAQAPTAKYFITSKANENWTLDLAATDGNGYVTVDSEAGAKPQVKGTLDTVRRKNEPKNEVVLQPNRFYEVAVIPRQMKFSCSFSIRDSMSNRALVKVVIDGAKDTLTVVQFQDPDGEKIEVPDPDAPVSIGGNAKKKFISINLDQVPIPTRPRSRS